MPAELWMFISTFGHHYLSLFTGGLLAFGIFLFEHKKGRSIPWRTIVILMVVAALVSCFQAWRDEYHIVKTLKSQNADLTRQIVSQANGTSTQRETASRHLDLPPQPPALMVVLPVVKEKQPSVELLCRRLEDCPSAELRRRALRVASDIDRLFAEYQSHKERIIHTILGDVLETHELRSADLHAWSEIGMGQYRSQYQVYAEAYRREMIQRLGPGAYDSNKNMDYSIAAIRHAGTVIDSLPAISGDLRSLAAQLPER